jgi:hypothetical protein
MRYARAIVLVDRGRSGEARTLLLGAPAWPADSAFRTFHEELLGHATPAEGPAQAVG